MAVCGTEEPGGVAVMAGVPGHSGEALEDVGDEQIRLEIGTLRERIVGVALALF